MTEQERIIGNHGNLKSSLMTWLQCHDYPTTATKIVRGLDENSVARINLIDECADWIVERHLGHQNRIVLEKKRQILSTAEFKDYVDIKHYLPISDTTRKGNLGEVLLYHYLEEVTGYTPISYKLAYNSNVEQSMKGDDVLLLNPTNVQQDLIYGESKIRKDPTKAVVEEIVDNLQGSKRLPTSLNFIIETLREKGDEAFADAIENMQIEMAKNNVPIRNIGMLLSRRGPTLSQDTVQTVLTHLNSSNPDLAFMAVGIDDVQQFVDEVYRKANNILYLGHV